MNDFIKGYPSSLRLARTLRCLMVPLLFYRYVFLYSYIFTYVYLFVYIYIYSDIHIRMTIVAHSSPQIYLLKSNEDEQKLQRLLRDLSRMYVRWARIWEPGITLYTIYRHILYISYRLSHIFIFVRYLRQIFSSLILLSMWRVYAKLRTDSLHFSREGKNYRGI